METLDQQPSKPFTLSLEAIKSLLFEQPSDFQRSYRPIFRANANTPETLPLNVEDELLSGCIKVLRRRHIDPTISYSPYWNRGIEYNEVEVFGTAIQILDLHDAPLPTTVLPPEEDVQTFIDAVKAFPGKAKIPDQLAIALAITKNNLIGAANLCWIATRCMARGAEQRAYPNISMTIEDIRSWNDEVAQFETYTNSGQNEGPGDTYYFWTHVFCAMVFSKRNIRSKVAQAVFGRGTEIMVFAKKKIARTELPVVTDHKEASELGRAIGLVFANLDKVELD